tara:strand:+ start:26984 stop:27607 length:624 start_codon:yes stop_codon:yes gene_type:complete
MKNQDTENITGHLEIWKVYESGEEVLAFDEDNTITSGMGVGLGMLYAGSGADDITNFQIRYFQVGVGGDDRLLTYGVNEGFLASSLGQVLGSDDYINANSLLGVSEHHLMDWDGGVRANSEGTEFHQFGTITDNSIKRVDTNSVTYIIYLDRYTCNDLTEPLNEVGLFMQNPIGLATNRSNLVAYRPFTNITKTSDFSLVFKWTLNF